MLSYSDSGSNKPTLLFLHGLGLNKNFWSQTTTQLSGNFRCIAVDLPGHGDSRNVATNGSMSAYANAIREFILEKQLSDITVVGHSMGGQIAIILALQMPAVISKLILVSSAGIETFTPEEGSKLKSATQSIYANPIGDDLLQRTYFHASAEIKSLLMHEHVVQQRENFKQLSALITSSVEGMLNEPVFNYLDKITQPVLCIYGQMDTAIPNRWLHPQSTVQHVQQVAETKLPDCQTRTFLLSGHYLPVDQPEELAKEIFRFV